MYRPPYLLSGLVLSYRQYRFVFKTSVALPNVARIPLQSFTCECMSLVEDVTVFADMICGCLFFWPNPSTVSAYT